MAGTAFITRVILRNYRSIKFCDVPLRSLNYLVGPNGAGKSNFLDGLRFIADSLNTTLENAIRSRGGISAVRRRSNGHPTHFSIEVSFRHENNYSGIYKFEIVAKKSAGFEVRSEECRVTSFFGGDSFYRVENGVVKSTNLKTPPTAALDRLYLVSVSGTPDFRDIYSQLSKMGFYNLNPDAIRELQSPDAGEKLSRDGGNISSVVRALDQYPVVKGRIQEFLSQIVSGVESVHCRSVGPKETIEFKQQIQGSRHPWNFYAENMSDGTLRSVGFLVALFQTRMGKESKIPFIGIEEPEVALHPGAAGVLRDALNEASEFTQILVTSHSPDLLDDSSISSEAILAVRSEKGITSIAPIDIAGRTAMRDRLYTAGDLLRLDQLMPDPDYAPNQISMFDDEESA